MPYLEQSFAFEWDTSFPFAVPITAQCKTIRITWARWFARGPIPFKPYSLVVYASNYTTPFIIDAGDGPSFDLTVPFPPGTRYMICMYDKNGNTGGCQDLYTVYDSSSSCSNNLTAPARALTVEQTTGTASSLPFSFSTTSQYEWIPTCTDLSYDIKDGTPPFQLTIASALRPPYNITFNSLGEFKWKVAFDHATPFFVSVQDATGLTWTNGVLHAASSTDSSCLSHKKGVPVGATAGVAVGAFVIGALLACLAAYFLKRRTTAHAKVEEVNMTNATPPVITNTYPTPHDVHCEPYQAVPVASAAVSLRSHENRDYNDRLSTVAGSATGRNDYRGTYYENNVPSSTTGSRHPDGFSDAGGRATSNIFTMHHDGGATPMTSFGPAGEGPPAQEQLPSYEGRNPASSDLNRAIATGRGNDGRPAGAAAPEIRSYPEGAGRTPNEGPDSKTAR